MRTSLLVIAPALAGGIVIACGGGGAPGAHSTSSVAPPRTADIVVGAEASARPSPPPSRSASPRLLEPLASATCIVRDTKVHMDRAIPLLFHGEPFAVTDVSDTAELRTAREAATLTVASRELVLTGEVAIESLRVHPLEPSLYDGWIRIHEATPHSVVGESLSADVALPNVVVPAKHNDMVLRCSDLAFGKTSARAYENPGKQVFLKQNARIDFRAAPGGDVVATLRTPAVPMSPPKPATARRSRGASGDLEAVLAAVDLRGMAALGQLEDALAAAELERSKGSVRIRLWSHDAAVEGWIDASALGPAPPPGASILSGGRDTSRAPSRRPPLRCPNDVALYVRAADEVVRVGTLRAGGRVQVVDEAGRQGAREDEREHDEVPVDLGANAFPNANGTRRLTPFVDRASLTACAEVARSAP